MDDPILEMYKEVLPCLKDFLCTDFMLALTNGQKFLGFWQKGKMNAPIKIGDIIKKDDPTLETFRTGKIIDKTLPADIHGFPFRSLTVPIKNKSNKIVGTINYGVSLEVRETVKNIQQQISKDVQNSIGNLKSISDFVNEVSNETKSITQIFNNIIETTTHIETVTKEISNISSQTNVLAMNASIEASHAGEFGKGFAIVAQEMKNLSTTTKISSNKILEILKDLSNGVTDVSSDLNSLIELVKKQQFLTKEIESNIQNIQSLSKSMDTTLKNA